MYQKKWDSERYLPDYSSSEKDKLSTEGLHIAHFQEKFYFFKKFPSIHWQLLIKSTIKNEVKQP